MRTPCWTLNHDPVAGRVSPQHQTLEAGYDRDAPDSVRRLRDDALADFEPNFGTLVIHGHARLTDLLSSSPLGGTGYLVSAKLRAALEAFALPPHRFYPVAVTHRGKAVAGYAWLHLPGPALPIPDTASAAEAEAAITAAPELAGLDLLRVRRPSRFAYCFVSDPLRRAIDDAGVTGVRWGTARLFR